MQTRMIAGIAGTQVGRYINLNNQFGRIFLKIAKCNLINNYEAYGLKECFKDSLELFAMKFHFELNMPKQDYKKTPQRPSVHRLSDEVVQQLKQSNSLDLELYDFAEEHFEEQFK